MNGTLFLRILRDIVDTLSGCALTTFELKRDDVGFRPVVATKSDREVEEDLLFNSRGVFLTIILRTGIFQGTSFRATLSVHKSQMKMSQRREADRPMHLERLFRLKGKLVLASNEL